MGEGEKYFEMQNAKFEMQNKKETLTNPGVRGLLCDRLLSNHVKSKAMIS